MSLALRSAREDASVTRRTTDLREVINAIFYILRAGCQWKMLPRDFPPRATVQRYFYAWRNEGIWQDINHYLVLEAREAEGREASPSAGVIDSQSANTKNELLTVLDRPDIPLHTNGSERDIRCQVTRRELSGGTVSDRGRDCRDGFLGLMNTCDKQGVSFWDYLGDRLAIPDAPDVPPLPDLIRARAPT
jgi:transposase